MLKGSIRTVGLVAALIILTSCSAPEGAPPEEAKPPDESPPTADVNGTAEAELTAEAQAEATSTAHAEATAIQAEMDAAATAQAVENQAILEALTGSFAGICDGEGNPEARAYSAQVETNPIIVLDENGAPHELNNLLPDAWLPQAADVSEVALVACLTPDSRVNETCEYADGYSVQYVQPLIELQIVAAQTGEVLVEKLLAGAEFTSACPPLIAVGEDDEPGLYTNETAPPSPELIQGWLELAAEPSSLAGLPDILRENFTGARIPIDAATEKVHRLAFSSDGAQLAVLHDEGITMLDTTTFEPVYEIDAWDIGPWGLAFSPDGRTLAFELRGSVMMLYDTVTQTQIRSWDVERSFNGLAFSPDGSLLITYQGSSTYNPPVRVWDTETGEEIAQIAEYTEVAAFSPDGQVLITGINDGTRPSLAFWDTNTWEEIDRWMIGSEFVSLDWSPDGRYIAATTADGFAMWDAESGEALIVCEACGGYGTQAVFSHSGEILAAGDARALTLWDVEARELISAPAFDPLVFEWSPGDDWIVDRIFGHTSILVTPVQTLLLPDKMSQLGE